MAINVKNDISDLIVSTDVLDDLLGYTRRHINQLTREGVLERKAPGRFLLMQNIKKYIDFIRTGQRSDEEEEATAQYWEEKALHEKAKREMAELKLAKLKNQLHDARDVEMVMTNMLVTFRNRILAMPSKLAPQLIGVTNLAEIQSIIDKEAREALTELSEYDPAMFAGGEELEEDDEVVSQDS
jgi:phage terminase Nu1 subunit (DNA packaging protein)